MNDTPRERFLRDASLTDAALGTLAALYLFAAVRFAAMGSPPPTFAVAIFMAVPLCAVGTRWLAATHPGRTSSLLRACWPVLVAPLVYMAEVRVVELGRSRYVDLWLAAVDARVGLANAAGPRLPLGGPIEELANAFYLTYYAIPLIVVAVAVWRGHEQAARITAALALTTLTCGVGWLLFPAGGYYAGGSPHSIPWGPCTAVAHALYAQYPHFGGAFPSEHVAHVTALVATSRRLGAPRVTWAWVAGIGFATIAGQYHFGTDAMAGLLVGVCAAAVVDSLVSGTGRLFPRPPEVSRRHVLLARPLWRQ